MSTRASLVAATRSARLPDRRLSVRVASVASTLLDGPSRSFPQAFAHSAELEGLYRLLNNRRVDFDTLLEPHYAATVERCRGPVLVVHDSTQFTFPGDQPIVGLGPADAGGRGFLGHFAVAVEPGEDRHLIGLLGVEPLIRGAFKHSDAKRKERYLAKDKESLRWTRMVA